MDSLALSRMSRQSGDSSLSSSMLNASLSSSTRETSGLRISALSARGSSSLDKFQVNRCGVSLRHQRERRNRMLSMSEAADPLPPFDLDLTPEEYFAKYPKKEAQPQTTAPTVRIPTPRKTVAVAFEPPHAPVAERLPSRRPSSDEDVAPPDVNFESSSSNSVDITPPSDPRAVVSDTEDSVAPHKCCCGAGPCVVM